MYEKLMFIREHDRQKTIEREEMMKKQQQIKQQKTENALKLKMLGGFFVFSTIPRDSASCLRGIIQCANRWDDIN